MLKESIVAKPSTNGRVSARPGSSMGSSTTASSKLTEAKPSITPTRLARPSKPVTTRAISP
jgi:hypothetical protein